MRSFVGCEAFGVTRPVSGAVRLAFEYQFGAAAFTSAAPD
jgi:hypothetical protein